MSRDPATDARRITRIPDFGPVLSEEMFAALPSDIRSIFPLLGVQVTLPFVLQYFGFAAADGSHPFAVRPHRATSREWSLKVVRSYAREADIENHAFIVPDESTHTLKAIAAQLPRIPARPEARYKHPEWSVDDIVRILEGARVAETSFRTVWLDYATERESVYAGYRPLDSNAILAMLPVGCTGAIIVRSSVPLLYQRTR